MTASTMAVTAGRGWPSTQAVSFASLLLLCLLLLGCCPAPAGASLETSFAAELTGLSQSSAAARLADGRQLRLSFGDDPGFPLAVGQRVYIEGVLRDDNVLVRRLVVLSAAPG